MPEPSICELHAGDAADPTRCVKWPVTYTCHRRRVCMFFLWQSALHVSAAADVTICVTSVFMCSAFIKHRKRKRWLSASSRVRMLQTLVIHIARMEVLDSSGHGDSRNLFPLLLMPIRCNLHRLHDIMFWLPSITMSTSKCLARYPPKSSNTFACSAGV